MSWLFGMGGKGNAPTEVPQIPLPPPPPGGDDGDDKGKKSPGQGQAAGPVPGAGSGLWGLGGLIGQAGGVPPAGIPPPTVPPNDKTKMDAYTFDSAALERAAKAAKDLESSSKST